VVLPEGKPWQVGAYTVPPSPPLGVEVVLEFEVYGVVAKEFFIDAEAEFEGEEGEEWGLHLEDCSLLLFAILLWWEREG